MCGIVYVRRGKNREAQRMAYRLFNKQRSRGVEGFGFVSMQDGFVKSVERYTEEATMRGKLKRAKVAEIIFHHRFPTSTPNLKEAAHPIAVSNESLRYDYHVIHNGVISNDDELKEKHEKLGFTYSTTIEEYCRAGDSVYRTGTSFNDSECLAIELALAIEGKQDEPEIDGSAAFIALQTEKGSGKAVALYYGRNSGSPLKVWVENDACVIASEGQGEDIAPHTLYRYSYELDRTSEIKMFLGTTYNYGTTSNYDSGHSLNCTCDQCWYVGGKYSSEDDIFSEPTPDDNAEIWQEVAEEYAEKITELFSELQHSKFEKNNAVTSMVRAKISTEVAKMRGEFGAEWLNWLEYACYPQDQECLKYIREQYGMGIKAHA